MNPTCECSSCPHRIHLDTLRGDLALWSISVDATRARYTQSVNELRVILDACTAGCIDAARRALALWIVNSEADRVVICALTGELQRIIQS